MSEATGIVLQIGMLLAAVMIMLVLQWRQVRAFALRFVGWQSQPATSATPVDSTPATRPAHIPPMRIIPGTKTALVEPPNLRETLHEIEYRDHGSRYRFPIGWGADRGENGLLSEIFAFGSFMNDANHILITAKSDVGKDNVAMTMLFSLALLHQPDEVQFCIIDGKGLDFSLWTEKAHVWRAALEPKQIKGAMDAITAERERRRGILSKAQVTKWDEYTGGDLPLLVIYVSELSLLQDEVGKSELSNWLNSELAAGRAFGLRFIIATQTASNFETRWRSQIDLHVAGYQTNDSQDEPNTGLSTKALRERGAVPPSELPGVPDGQGVFTAVHGRTAVTIRAVYIPGTERQRWLAHMPNRAMLDLLSTFLEKDLQSEATLKQPDKTWDIGETGASASEIPRSAETSFPAEESESTKFTTPFTPDEIGQIVALVASGKGKTEVIRSMPRYSGRKHKEYAALYDTLYMALQVRDSIEA